MPVTALTLADGGLFDSGAVLVDSGFTLIGVIPVGYRRGRIGIDLLVAVAALTSLKVTRAVRSGGHNNSEQVDLAVDAAVGTVTTEIPSCIPASNPHLSIAGTRIQLILNADGVAEYGIYAKSGGTATLQLTGRLPKAFNN